MPWRAGRRWWWCGCDGSGVRRRRVRGRRGWRGGVGCGWHRFTHWAVAAPGVVAVLPGAVAPERAPRLQGLAQGLGGACVGGAHGSGRCDRCPRRRVVRRGRWTGDLDPWSLWWTRPVRHRPSRCLRRPDRLPGGADRVVGAPCGCWWPSRRSGGRTGPVTKAVQQNPDQVGTRVKSTTQRRFGRAAAGARGACGPPRGPPAGSPAGARSSRKSPAPASKRLGPPGRGSPLDPGAASEIDLLEGGRDRAA